MHPQAQGSAPNAVLGSNGAGTAWMGENHHRKTRLSNKDLEGSNQAAAWQPDGNYHGGRSHPSSQEGRMNAADLHSSQSSVSRSSSAYRMQPQFQGDSQDRFSTTCPSSGYSSACSSTSHPTPYDTKSGAAPGGDAWQVPSQPCAVPYGQHEAEWAGHDHSPVSLPAAPISCLHG